MNQWEKAFAEHAVHQILADCMSLAEGVPLKTPDASVADSYRHILLILKHTKRLLALADPNLLLTAQLDPLTPPLQSLKSALTNYTSNPSPSYLSQATTYADQILVRLNSFPLFSLPKSAGALKESMESFSRTSAELLNSLKTTADEMRTRVAEITEEISTHRASIDKHETMIESQKARIDSVVSEFQSQFSSAEDKRREAHASDLKASQADYAAFKEQLEEEQASFFKQQSNDQAQRLEKLDEQANTTLKRLADYEKQAANIVQIISNIGVTGNYSKYATADRKTANVLRVLAVLFMVGLICGAIATIWLAIKEGAIDWHIVGFRIFVTLTFAVPAFYLAYESEKHRTAERRYRTKELELASIDPYLEKLPEEIRLEIKGRLTERFFGGLGSESHVKDDSVSAKSMWDFIKEVVETAIKHR